ncbi:MAG: hypothetical protein LBN08_07350 [Lactobacillales bacterium]|jgi:hypothetical protein|nr:hypothetical protein [Lactobacillales bacterium]
MRKNVALFSFIATATVAAGLIVTTQASAAEDVAPQYKTNYTLGKKFDPRPWLTPIRDQHTTDDDPIPNNNQSICWSYSGNDLLTFSKQKHLWTTSIFSPNYTNKLTAVDVFGEPKLVNGELTNINPNGNTERPLNDGGNLASPAILSMIGYNPALESNFSSVNEAGIATGVVATKIEEFDSFENFVATGTDKTFSVSDINKVEFDVEHKNFQKHIDQMKAQILQNGGIGFGFNASLTYDDSCEFWNPETSAYDYNLPKVGVFDVGDGTQTTYDVEPIDAVDHINHATMIIGWDDDFARTNFNVAHQPSQNGAFIVRNSWGKDFGDNGYFYVSYEDYFVNASIGGYSPVVTVASHDHPEALQKTNPRQNMFYTAWISGFLRDPNDTRSDIVLVNSFPAKETKTKLDAVAIDVNLDDVDYEIYIKEGELDKADKTVDSLAQDSATLVAKGHQAIGGMHKKYIPMTTIPKNTKYSIIVVEHAKDKSVNNPASSLFVSPALVVGSYDYSNVGKSYIGYLSPDDKITQWIDFANVNTKGLAGKNRGIGVIPYIFGYSVN